MHVFCFINLVLEKSCNGCSPSSCEKYNRLIYKIINIENRFGK